MMMDDPVGRVAELGDEPASAFYSTAPVPSALLQPGRIMSRSVLERRGADRSDQMYLPSLDAAARVLGGAAVSCLIDLALHANDRWWRLEVDSWQFKVLRYRQGHYAPAHVDMFPGSMRRKLSMIVQLTGPNGYEGGDLELVSMGEAWSTVPRQAGLAAVFPSWVRHRVSRVTAGERWTLAVWGYGEPVR